MSEADSHAATPAQAGFELARVIATASSTAIIESRPI